MIGDTSILSYINKCLWPQCYIDMTLPIYWKCKQHLVQLLWPNCEFHAISIPFIIANFCEMIKIWSRRKQCVTLHCPHVIAARFQRTIGEIVYWHIYASLVLSELIKQCQISAFMNNNLAFRCAYSKYPDNERYNFAINLLWVFCWNKLIVWWRG